MNKTRMFCNVRDLVLTYGDEHPMWDRDSWSESGDRLDYWQWVAVQINQQAQAHEKERVQESVDRVEKEKLFFFELDKQDGSEKRIVRGRKKDSLSARRKLMSIIGINCSVIQKMVSVQ